ncbi:MAG: SMC-Scp complex subunit ScpB [Gammaproteobacteria bacterium]|nr:SMC-Scp complex subunit ScpB [Gammaproteobacteria bacterium]
MIVTPDNLTHSIRAILYSAGRPMTTKSLAELLMQESKVIEQALLKIKKDLESDPVLLLHESRSGWRFSIKAPFTEYAHKLISEKPIKLSKSSLEILSIIAYHQPVTRSDIEKIRGVSTNPAALKQLFEWQWIETAGYKEVPGRPELLKTTVQFCDDFGIKSLKELPVIEDNLPASVERIPAEAM